MIEARGSHNGRQSSIFGLANGFVHKFRNALHGIFSTFFTHTPLPTTTTTPLLPPHRCHASVTLDLTPENDPLLPLPTPFVTFLRSAPVEVL